MAIPSGRVFPYVCQSQKGRQTEVNHSGQFSATCGEEFEEELEEAFIDEERHFSLICLFDSECQSVNVRTSA
jgi:hypothetical protein